MSKRKRKNKSGSNTDNTNQPPVLDHVEVVGSNDILDDPWLWWMLYDFENHYLLDFIPDGAIESGWLNPQCTCPKTAEETEAWVDAIASNMAKEIKSKPDYLEVEYVGVIYRHTDGQIKAGVILQGSSKNAPLGRAITESGTTPEMIMAVIHNHPEKSFSSGDKEKMINTLPSEGDWKNAEYLFKERESGITYYIIGTDHKIREYEYEDREEWIRKLVRLRTGSGNRRLVPTPSIPDDLPLPNPCPIHGESP